MLEERSSTKRIIFCFFFVAYFLFLAQQSISGTLWWYSTGNTIDSVRNFVESCTDYILCVIKIGLPIALLLSFKSIPLFAISATLSVFCKYFAVDNTMYLTFLLLALVANVGKRKAVLTHLIVVGVSFILTVGTVLFSVVEDAVNIDHDRIRYFLGFGWTTTPPILFLFLTFDLIYLFKGNMKNIAWLALFGINAALFIYTNTRFAFVISMLAIVFFALGFHKHINCREIKPLMVLSPFLFAGFISIVSYVYSPDNQILKFINKLLSGRLALGKRGFENFGIKPFGQEIQWIGFTSSGDAPKNYNYVDSSFLQILFNYGWIILLFVLICYSFSIKKAIDNNEFFYAWILVFILLFSITEPRLINIRYNVFFLLLFCDWINPRENTDSQLQSSKELLKHK